MVCVLIRDPKFRVRKVIRHRLVKKSPPFSSSGSTLIGESEKGMGKRSKAHHLACRKKLNAQHNDSRSSSSTADSATTPRRIRSLTSTEAYHLNLLGLSPMSLSSSDVTPAKPVPRLHWKEALVDTVHVFDKTVSVATSVVQLLETSTP